MKLGISFQSVIQKNKDWNNIITHSITFALALSERHPEKQGLKLNFPSSYRLIVPLSERHPEKQGLKPKPDPHVDDKITLSERHPEKQGLKLWGEKWYKMLIQAFRASSRKTRIETKDDERHPDLLLIFQSVIQKNKDWNWHTLRG